MPASATKKATLALHLVQVLDGLWALQNRLRGVADQAQDGLQDACSAIGVEARHAAPEILARADELARAALDPQVKELVTALRELATKLEEG